MNPTNINPTQAGTFGGTLLILWVNLENGDISRTIILAAIGAAVSFVVSLSLKSLTKVLRR